MPDYTSQSALCCNCLIFHDTSKLIQQDHALWCKPCWKKRYMRCLGPKCFRVIGAGFQYCSGRCAARARLAERDEQ